MIHDLEFTREDFIRVLTDLCGREVLFSGVSLNLSRTDWCASIECTITGNRGSVTMDVAGYAEPCITWI